MIEKRISLVKGDGSGPEMMAVACEIAIEAAKKDDIQIVFEETPMGWNAYDEHGDTVPESSFRRATEIGVMFFGGVGDPSLDKTLGAKHPEMKPEARALLRVRKEWGLLLNYRFFPFDKKFADLSPLKNERIPDGLFWQMWVRYLLEDSYFGTVDLMQYIPADVRERLGIKLKHEITGNEEMVTELAYYTKANLEKYFRVVFALARKVGLPVICVNKANVMSRYEFWNRVCARIAKEFPDVEVRYQYVDSANELLFNPGALNAVIPCGNEHGDVVTDGAAKANASMGMMYSASENPDNRMAMFESGAGTAPTLAGKDMANPIGRILAGAMMLRHIGAPRGADAIEKAVNEILTAGWRTGDILSQLDDKNKLLGTKAMGQMILSRLS